MRMMAVAMSDELDPPRKFYALKPRTFERANELRPQLSLPGKPPDPPENQRIDVRDHYERAKTPGPVLTLGQKVGLQNDVHVILQDNLVHANAGGLNNLAPKRKRRSRRTRDYFVVVIPLDAFFAYVAFGHYSNVMTMAYGVAGIIISTIGLGWVMFGVMDDY
jgi:hypothetical protein